MEKRSTEKTEVKSTYTQTYNERHLSRRGVKEESKLVYKAMNIPRPAGIEISKNISRNFSVIQRTRENVTIPVRRRSAEAAPHTNFPEPCFPNDYSLAKKSKITIVNQSATSSSAWKGLPGRCETRAPLRCSQAAH